MPELAHSTSYDKCAGMHTAVGSYRLGKRDEMLLGSLTHKLLQARRHHLHDRRRRELTALRDTHKKCSSRLIIASIAHYTLLIAVIAESDGVVVALYHLSIVIRHTAVFALGAELFYPGTHLLDSGMYALFIHTCGEMHLQHSVHPAGIGARHATTCAYNYFAKLLICDIA